jgi:oxygen-dependent protoporphyrinogen oxidase
MSEPLHAVVVGAGISGLTAAFRLARGGMRVTVLEAAARPGGTLRSRGAEGFLFEMGPNTILESDASLPALIADCGLAAERQVAAPAGHRRYVWSRGRLVALPGGPLAFLRSPLFSAAAKLRLLGEPFVRPAATRHGENEETIADFTRRRLGAAFLANAVGPFVSGIYAGDPERLSLRWAMPRLAALEAEHGSLLLGLLARGLGRPRPAPRPAAGPRGAMISLSGGIETLAARLAREIGDVRYGVACRRVLWAPAGARTADEGPGFVVEYEGGALRADRVVLAVPAYVAAELLADATAGGSCRFAELPYASVAVVAMGYRRTDVRHPLDGFGFLRALGTPADEMRLLGCLFTSSLFAGRAPADHVSLTAFLGGSTDPEAAGWDDDRLVATVQRNLQRALGVQAPPVAVAVQRWPRGIPQYEVGHGSFLALRTEIERSLPGLQMTGSYLQGVAVADCVRQADAAARHLLAFPSPPPSSG